MGQPSTDLLETGIDASESPLGTFDTTLRKLEGCKQLQIFVLEARDNGVWR
jgi:hypothetical protein